jgi:hypothetical protein
MTYSQPVDDVRVGGVTSATSILLVTGTVDDDGVLKSSLINCASVAAQSRR